MEEKKLNELDNSLDISTMFLKAAEEVTQANAERDERNKAKAAAAVERRRREKALNEAYAEYSGNNPPTDSECKAAAEIIKSCIKGKEDNNE